MSDVYVVEWGTYDRCIIGAYSSLEMAQARHPGDWRQEGEDRWSNGLNHSYRVTIQRLRIDGD